MSGGFSRSGGLQAGIDYVTVREGGVEGRGRKGGREEKERDKWRDGRGEGEKD